MTQHNPDRESLPGSRHVPIGELRTAEEYQRDLDHNRVEHIARHFDVHRLGVFEVSQRHDRHYYVIDGNHRFQALLLLGWTAIQVPCVIHRGLTLPQEADLFRKLNTERRRPEAYDLYRAGLVANDQKLRDIDTIIREVGLLAVGRTSVAPNGFKAVRTAEEIYDFHGPKLLWRVLTVVVAAWPHDPLNARSSKMLDTLTAFIVTHAAHGKNVDNGALIRACATQDPGHFLASGGAAVRTIQVYQKLASDLYEPYNRAAKASARVPFLTPKTFSKRPRRPERGEEERAARTEALKAAREAAV